MSCASCGHQEQNRQGRPSPLFGLSKTDPSNLCSRTITFGCPQYARLIHKIPTGFHGVVHTAPKSKLPEMALGGLTIRYIMVRTGRSLRQGAAATTGWSGAGLHPFSFSRQLTDGHAIPLHGSDQMNFRSKAGSARSSPGSCGLARARSAGARGRKYRAV